MNPSVGGRTARSYSGLWKGGASGPVSRRCGTTSAWADPQLSGLASVKTSSMEPWNLWKSRKRNSRKFSIRQLPKGKGSGEVDRAPSD